ncbi:MAG: prepilin-type N-terminal cleavage/methylation domain-containing protein [Planctomycetota bacterium]|nr:prepilin-type N-terminal cleavage/methylation domain-containing protein [Planctomycetota bacterium]
MTRKGFTLSELMVSLFAFSILATCLLSVLAVSTRTLQIGNSSAAQTSKAMQISSRILGDIVLAKRFIHRSASAVEFSTSDRDGDGHDDFIRFEHFPSPEKQIVKTSYFTRSGKVISETIAHQVSEFDFDFVTQQGNQPPIASRNQSREKLLFSNDLSLDHLTLSRDRDSRTGSLGITGPLPGIVDLVKTGLLVVADSGALNPHETALKNRMTSLGITVQIIDDSAPPTKFETELSDCDFVYIPRSIDRAQLGDKVRETTAGILNESLGLCETLGFGESSSQTIAGHFLEWIQDSTPLLDSSIAGGTDFFETAQTVHTLSSVPEKNSPNLRTLARTAGNISMAFLETGDLAVLGNSSPETKLGFDVEFSKQSFPFRWNHVATRCRFNKTAVANSISVFNSRGTTSTLRLGIYSDQNGKPGTLLAETDFQQRPSVISGEWTTLELKNSLELSPGDYWIVASVFGSVQFFYQQGGTTRTCLTLKSIDEGMMDQWGKFQDYRYDAKLSMSITCQIPDQVRGRRMFVPWSGPAVDLDQLTDKGINIFKRCLRWAATKKDDSNVSVQTVTENNPGRQYIRPVWEADEAWWKVSRISLFVRPLETAQLSHFRLSVYQADRRGNASDRLLGRSDWIATNHLKEEHFRWWTVPIDEFKSLSTQFGISILLETDSTHPCLELVADHNTPHFNAHLSNSTDRGASWQNSSTDENLRTYIFGSTSTEDP